MMGKGVFLSTQYMRHHSVPLYTPEPDVVHELVGHAASLFHPGIVKLSRRFGEAAWRVDDAALKRLELVYWYTLEFGLVEEDGVLKAFGAGLLSSFGELGSFETHAEIRPLDCDEAASIPYDPTQYQKVLYASPSFERMVEDVSSWLEQAVTRRRCRGSSTSRRRSRGASPSGRATSRSRAASRRSRAG